MSGHRPLAIGLLGLALAASAACSSGSGESGVSSPRTLPTVALISRADAICRRVGHAQTLIFDRASTASQRQAAWGGAKRELVQGLADLRTLRPPPQNTHDYAAFLDAVGRIPPFYDQLAAVSRNGSQDDQLHTLGEAFFRIAHADDLGAALGLHDCALDYDTADPPRTKADYIQTIDNVCLDVGAAASTLPHATTLQQLADSMGRLVEPLRAFTRDLQSIKPPPGDEATLRPWIDAQLQGAAALIDMHTAAAAGDLAALHRAVHQAVSAQRRADKVAIAYGIDGCTDTSYLNSA
jgi:hypothetical protein